MSRLSRKKRNIDFSLDISKDGRVYPFDMIDKMFMQLYYLTFEEYDIIMSHIEDDKIEKIIIDEISTISEIKLGLSIIDEEYSLIYTR